MWQLRVLAGLLFCIFWTLLFYSDLHSRRPSLRRRVQFVTRALAAGAATEQLQEIDGGYPASSIHDAVIVSNDNRAAAADGDGGTHRMMMLHGHMHCARGHS
eukprot:COSAG05_NODE_2537_length_2932_cov_1.785739_1_plen_102_part_00